MGNLAFKVTENGTIDRSCTPYYYSYICSIFELFDVENIVTLKSRLGVTQGQIASFDTSYTVPICLP